jgi:hypothetical protein
MFFKQVITFAATTLASCLVLVGVAITGYPALGSGPQQAPAGAQPSGGPGRPVGNLNGASKPADLPFDPKGPLPEPGGLFKDGFNAAFVDASVRFVGRGTDSKQQDRLLKAFITRNGKEKVSLDQLPQIPNERLNLDEGAPKNLAPADQAKKAVAVEPSNPPGDPVKKGAIAQIQVARDAIRTIEQMRTSGQAVSERDYAEWSIRLMQAKRAFDGTTAGEIEALEAHASRMKDSRERAHGLYRAGQANFLQYLDAIYRYNEATTWVEKAKAEAAQHRSR